MEDFSTRLQTYLRHDQHAGGGGSSSSSTSPSEFCNEQDLSNLAHGAAKSCVYKEVPDLCPALAKYLMHDSAQALTNLSCQGLANTFFAFSKFYETSSSAVGESFIKQFCGAIRSKAFSEYSASQLASVVTSYARLQVLDEELLNVSLPKHVSTWSTREHLSPQVVANLLSAYASFGCCNATIMPLLAAAAGAHVTRFKEQELMMSLHAFARLDYHDERLIDLLAEKTMGTKLTSQGFAHILLALARLQGVHSNAARQMCRQISSARMDFEDPQHVANCILASTILDEETAAGRLLQNWALSLNGRASSDTRSSSSSVSITLGRGGSGTSNNATKSRKYNAGADSQSKMKSLLHQKNISHLEISQAMTALSFFLSNPNSSASRNSFQGVNFLNAWSLKAVRSAHTIFDQLGGDVWFSDNSSSQLHQDVASVLRTPQLLTTSSRNIDDVASGTEKRMLVSLEVPAPPYVVDILCRQL